jgi:GT2 family glycosyltransferase
VNPKVSIIILGHNAHAHFQDCLNSIFCQTFQDFEVIWVDSSSIDDSLQRIQAQFPEVKIVALSTNVGYRRATNIGAHEAKGEFMVICNQDTRMDRHWLIQMIKCVEADHTIGIVAPKILMFDDTQVINEAGNVLHYTGLYGSRGLGSSAAEYSVSEPIVTMSGCCFLIRHELWLETGGFSEDFDKLDTGWHASFEDVDLAWRSQLAGYKIQFCASALMYHKYVSKGMIPSRFCGYEWGRYLVLIRNYEFVTVILLLPLLLALEAGTWFYAIGKGWPWLKVKAKVVRWLATNMAPLYRMRQGVQKIRRIRDAAIVTRMDSTIRIAHVMSSSRLARLGQLAINTIFMAYYRFLLFGLGLWETCHKEVKR